MADMERGNCSSQHDNDTSIDDLPEGGLPDQMQHTTQVTLLQQTEEVHLQTSTTADHKPAPADAKSTSDRLQQNNLGTTDLNANWKGSVSSVPHTHNQNHRQKDNQHLEEENLQNNDIKDQHKKTNENITHLQLITDVIYDKEVVKLHNEDRGKERNDTQEIGDNKNTTIQKINYSRSEVDNRIVGNTEIHTKKEILDDIKHNSTNCSNENKVNCDSNNNLENKDIEPNGDVVINNRKISDVVILINDEDCDTEKKNSTSKNNKLKNPENPIYSAYRLKPPLNKGQSVPTLKIAPPLNKVNSEPNLRLSSNFTDYKNSYIQRHDSELSLKKDSPRESENNKKQDTKKSLEVLKIMKSNCCIFCGEGSQLEDSGAGQLVIFCQCSASAHSGCLLGYVTYPSALHDRCCVCRSKLQYTVIDKDTPMQIKYAIALVLISMTYMALVLLSLDLTQKLIPIGEIHEFFYLLIIGNVGFIPPAIIVFIISCLLNLRRPQPKFEEPEGNTSIHRRFSTWFGCSADDCDEKSCGGDACGVILAAFCLLSVMVVLISSSIYICYNVYLYYKSFKLKSKKSIRFQNERNNKKTSSV